MGACNEGMRKLLMPAAARLMLNFHGEETMRIALEQTHFFFICMASNPCVAIVNRFVYTVIAHKCYVCRFGSIRLKTLSGNVVSWPRPGRQLYS